MKKVILIFTVLLFFIASCGNDKSGEDASSSQDTENIENQKEIEATDSTINEMENTQKEIEESTQKVDKHINDL
ncbi:MAG: hypothetical protein K9I29_07290 [Bacteroidales bacterium]|nr:hypothetical protein [Bacteroidales bacterium]MCF8328085.1 hypothetical protein [Bacteroidales bacterium]